MFLVNNFFPRQTPWRTNNFQIITAPFKSIQVGAWSLQKINKYSNNDETTPLGNLQEAVVRMGSLKPYLQLIGIPVIKAGCDMC